MTLNRVSLPKTILSILTTRDAKRVDGFRRYKITQSKLKKAQKAQRQKEMVATLAVLRGERPE